MVSRLHVQVLTVQVLRPRKNVVVPVSQPTLEKPAKSRLFFVGQWSQTSFLFSCFLFNFKTSRPI